MRNDFVEYLCCFIGLIMIMVMLVIALIITIIGRELIMTGLIAGLIIASIFPFRDLLND